jgi:probable HAF family extracellular repeat protein
MPSPSTHRLGFIHMPTFLSRTRRSHFRELFLAVCLALGCGGDSFTEPEPNNPGNPDNPGNPNNPEPAPLPARTDLGTLGGESSYAFDVNDNGVVVGASHTTDGVFHGFRWSAAGGLQPLPPLPGDSASRAIAIANDDVVLGVSIARGGSSRPVVWSAAGTATLLAVSEIAGAELTPNDRNTQQTVVGDALFFDNPDALAHAWVWNAAGGLVDLADRLEVAYESYASAVGESGHVVGTLGGGLWRAYIWDTQRGARNLGVPGDAPDFTEVTAQGVNGSGQVAGWVRLLPPDGAEPPPPEPPFSSFGSHAFTWTEATGFTLLPGFPGDVPSDAVASDLNDRGDVVGSATPPQGDAINAVAWRRGGAIAPLNGSDLNSSVALAVNDAGVAVGWTSTGGEGPDRATVWNIELAAPLTARVGRTTGPVLRVRSRPWSGAAACLQDPAHLVSKARLADCIAGKSH